MRGTELKNTIHQAVDKANRMADDAHKKVRNASAELDQLIHRQASLATDLAHVVFHNVGTHDQGGHIAQRLRKAIVARDADQSALQEQARNTRIRLGLERKEMETARLLANKTEDAEADLRRAAVELVLGQDKWRELDGKIKRVEEQIERTHVKLDTAKEDAAQKAPAYENDPMFSYLLGRKFGQEGYEGGVISSRIDRWISKAVNFPRYISDYQRLQAIPEKISDHIGFLENQRAQMGHALAQEIDRVAAEYPGYAAAVENNKRAQNLANTKDLEAMGVEKELSILDHTLSTFSQGKDKHTLKALSLVKELIREGKNEQARALVTSTQTIEDDRLLNNIQQVGEQITSALEHVNAAKNEYEEAKDRQDKARAFSSRFDRAGLGDSDQRHSSVDVESLQNAILMGYALNSVFSQIERNARTISTTSSNSSWGSGSGGFGGGSSGFGGGGFSSGDSFGGGGFSTGDGF